MNVMVKRDTSFGNGVYVDFYKTQKKGGLVVVAYIWLTATDNADHGTSTVQSPYKAAPAIRIVRVI